jgi:hypothetical protein
MEDLPVVRKIGDIIRVHRAIVKEYKGLKQFNVNITYNSSWCLFHSSDILLKDSKVSDESSEEEMETELADGSITKDSLL